MSADTDNGPVSPGRRMSLVDFFTVRPPQTDKTDPTPAPEAQPPPSDPQTIPKGRARGMSITTLGLSASPKQGQPTSPFGTFKRGQSMGEALKMNPDDEDAMDDDAESARPTSPRRSFSSSPTFTRRMSSSGGSSSNGGPEKTPSENGKNGSSSVKAHTPSAVRMPQGFDWSENLRNRAKRASISAGSNGPSSFPPARTPNQPIAAKPQQPPAPMTQSAPQKKATRPDHFQERILKGDFYMD